MTRATAPVAAEIMAGRPPTKEMVTAMVKAANSPIRGSTPAMMENAMASGIRARATTRPPSTSVRRRRGDFNAPQTDCSSWGVGAGFSAAVSSATIGSVQWFRGPAQCTPTQNTTLAWRGRWRDQRGAQMPGRCSGRAFFHGRVRSRRTRIANRAGAAAYLTRSSRRSARISCAPAGPRPRNQTSSLMALAWPALTAPSLDQTGPSSAACSPVVAGSP